MNETKKAGVVTRLAETMMGVAILKDVEVAPGAIAPFMEKRADDLAELDYDRLRALDLVASWPPELRAVMELIEALTSEGKALLPDVLRGLSVKGMPALVESRVGAASTAAKVAAWAGKLDEADARLVLDAIREHGRARRQAGEDAMADACVQIGVELQEALGLKDVSVEGARLAAYRMPQRQLKGTCPWEVIPGQVRELDGTAWKVESIEGIMATIATDTARTTVHLDHLRTWPLAEDFEPSTGKPEPRVWKAGTVPPVVLPGMKVCIHGEGKWTVHGQERPGGMVELRRYDRVFVEPEALLSEWKLAEDFPIPEDA